MFLMVPDRPKSRRIAEKRNRSLAQSALTPLKTPRITPVVKTLLFVRAAATRGCIGNAPAFQRKPTKLPQLPLYHFIVHTVGWIDRNLKLRRSNA